MIALLIAAVLAANQWSGRIYAAVRPDGPNGAVDLYGRPPRSPELGASATPIPHRKKHSIYKKRSIIRKRSNVARSSELRMALLALREEMLHDFLAQMQTEKAAAQDARIVKLDGGINIGPVAVTTDFLGDCNIRARVVNASGRPLNALIVLAGRSRDDTAFERASLVDNLPAGASRTIELLAPGEVMLPSLRWKALVLNE